MSEQAQGSILSEDGISAAIGKLMAHPEIIQSVASALKGDAPTAAEEKKQEEKQDAPAGDTESDLAASLMPIIAKLGGGIGGGIGGGMGSGMGGGGASASRHSALLCALRPYLSDKRQDALDGIIKISQMSALISRLR